PGYMAPEQARGRVRDIGPATDVYGLGAVLYELLTGRPPFRAETARDTLREVLEKEPVRPRALDPGIDRDLEAICLRCLQKEPGRRCASARDLAAALHRSLVGAAVGARGRRSGLGQLFRGVRRHPVAASFFFAAPLGIATSLLLVGRKWQTMERDRQRAV